MITFADQKFSPWPNIESENMWWIQQAKPVESLLALQYLNIPDKCRTYSISFSVVFGISSTWNSSWNKASSSSAISSSKRKISALQESEVWLSQGGVLPLLVPAEDASILVLDRTGWSVTLSRYFSIGSGTSFSLGKLMKMMKKWKESIFKLNFSGKLFAAREVGSELSWTLEGSGSYLLQGLVRTVN